MKKYWGIRYTTERGEHFVTCDRGEPRAEAEEFAARVNGTVFKSPTDEWRELPKAYADYISNH